MCASDELRANQKVVFAAVKQPGHALHDASVELRADKEIFSQPRLTMGFC